MVDTTKTKLNTLIERNRELKAEFNGIIKDLTNDLWSYCKYLTGSPWDGEDLFQETMVKAFGSLYQRWHPTNPKAYLYRIATTTWIDHCRREKRNLGTLKEEDMPVEEFQEQLDVEEALKCLFHLFTPRQSAVFLLKEIFAFDAKEVAGMVHTTPGAVYATVRRMRKVLQENRAKHVSESEPVSENRTVIQLYLKALNEGDVDQVLSLLSEEAQNEAALGFQEFDQDEMRSGSMRFGLPGLRAESVNLWGIPVIVVFHDGEHGPEIHDIQYQEVENEKIVYHRSYYFRKEFIYAAAEELGYPPQTAKPVVDW